MVKIPKNVNWIKNIRVKGKKKEKTKVFVCSKDYITCVVLWASCMQLMSTETLF